MSQIFDFCSMDEMNNYLVAKATRSHTIICENLCNPWENF